MHPVLIGVAVAAAVLLDLFLLWRFRGRKPPPALIEPLENLKSSRLLLLRISTAARIERTAEFVVGCAFIVAAQVLFFLIAPVVRLYRLAEWLVPLLRIDVVNSVNTILGGCLLLVGIFLVARAVRPARYADPADLARPKALDLAGRQLNVLVLVLVLASMALFALLLWQLSSHEPPSYLPFLWATSLALAAIWAWSHDRRLERPLRPTADRFDLVALVVLLVIGLGVGAFRLESIPSSLIGDEGNFWETASAVARGELRQSFFGFGVYSYPMLSSIYQGLVLRVFGLSLWSWRLASVLAAMAAVIPTYLLARELFDRRIALMSSALMVVTPYFIALERLGYNNTQALLPVTLAVYLVYSGLRRSSFFYLLLGGIAAGLGFYTYTAGRLALVVSMLFIILTMLSRRGRLGRQGLALAGVFIAGWAITSIPHLYHGWVADPIALRYKTLESLFPNIHYALDVYPPSALVRDYPLVEFGPNSFFYRADLYAQLVLRGILRTGLAFAHPNLVTSHFIAAPLAGPLAGTFMAIGLALSLAGIHQKNYQLVIIWLLAGLVLLSVLNTFPPRHLHMVPIMPPMAILTGLGLATGSDFLGGLLPKQRQVYAAVFGVAGLLLLAFTGLKNYFVTAQYRNPPNLENLIAFTALALEDPQDLIYIAPSPELLEFEPWILSRIPNHASYKTVAVQELQNIELSAQSSVKVFFEQQDIEAVQNWVEQSLGGEAVLSSHRLQGRIGRAFSYSYEPDEVSTIAPGAGQD